MKALGAKGGRGSRGPNPKRVHTGLREYLRSRGPLEQVWQALRAAMEGDNQSAKVAASRVLMDALADEHSFEEQDYRAKIAAEQKAMGAEAEAKLIELCVNAVVQILEGRPDTGSRPHGRRPARRGPAAAGQAVP